MRVYQLIEALKLLDDEAEVFVQGEYLQEATMPELKNVFICKDEKCQCPSIVDDGTCGHLGIVIKAVVL